VEVGDDQQIRGYGQSQRRVHVIVAPVRHGIGAVGSAHLGGRQAGSIGVLVARGRRRGGHAWA